MRSSSSVAYSTATPALRASFRARRSAAQFFFKSENGRCPVMESIPPFGVPSGKCRTNYQQQGSGGHKTVYRQTCRRQSTRSRSVVDQRRIGFVSACRRTELAIRAYEHVAIHSPSNCAGKPIAAVFGQKI